MDIPYQIWYILPPLLIIVVMALMRFKPTNEADWAPDQKVLAFADINSNLVTIHNVRNFKYKSQKDYTPLYYDKTYDINKIKSVDFAFVPFSRFKFLAHTFLTFGFEDGSYVAISVEIRKKIGQEFSALISLFNQYELMYVIADENDVIKLRTNYRKNEPTYLYPMKINKGQMQKLFLSMIKRANKLKDQPEFYNLFNNTCTTNPADHIREIAPEQFRLSYKVFLPGYSAQLTYESGLIDTDLPFEKARAKFLINEKGQANPDENSFSRKIRE